MTTELAVNEEVLEQGIAIANDQATSLQVVDVATYEQAGAMLVGIKSLKKNIEEYFKPLKEAAYKAHKAITQRETEELDKLKPAIKHLSDTMAAWQAEQDRLRSIEEARLAEEARKLAEERQIAEAILAEQAGDKAEAEAILSEPVQAVAPILQSAVPKVAGLAMKDYWDFEIVNELLIPRQYLIPNMPAISAIISQLKHQAVIPGIRVVKTSKMVGCRS